MLMNFVFSNYAFPFLQKGRAFGLKKCLPPVILRAVEGPNVGSKANKSLRTPIIFIMTQANVYLIV
jgi:hypothetical protein